MHTQRQFAKASIFYMLKIFYKLNVLKFYYNYIHKQLPNYFYNFDFASNSDFHNYNTRTKGKLRCNRTLHKFTDTCLRSQLPNFVNNTKLNILEKLYTHSYHGFINYIKYQYLSNYETICQIDNCLCVIVNMYIHTHTC